MNGVRSPLSGSCRLLFESQDTSWNQPKVVRVSTIWWTILRIPFGYVSSAPLPQIVPPPALVLTRCWESQQKLWKQPALDPWSPGRRVADFDPGTCIGPENGLFSKFTSNTKTGSPFHWAYDTVQWRIHWRQNIQCGKIEGGEKIWENMTSRKVKTLDFHQL